MKPRRIFPTLAALCLLTLTALGTGCGDDSLLLGLPDGELVAWGGSIRVEATILEQGNKPPDGEEVLFSTTVGSFAPYSSEDPEPLREFGAETRAGIATATLYSFPGEGGKEGTVSASYVTIGSKNVSDSIPVRIAEGGIPSAKFLSANCDPVNISVWADPAEREQMKVRCTVTVKDITGQLVPRAQINTLVESGCTVQRVDLDNPDAYVFALQPTAGCEPMDVEPLSGEPNHMEQGVIHNPRDGLLTIVFFLTGQEGFIDSNGNGAWDPGEGFVGQDRPEPYVDANDNGEFDAGESYHDTNHDSEWTNANGQWDGDTVIWTATRILFSGRPHESVDTTRFSPAGISVPNGGTQTLVLYLMDINHNPIAANDDGDEISFDGVDVDITSADTISLKRTMGVEFSQSDTVIVESFNRDRDYQVTLGDSDPSTDQEEPVSLQTEINYTPAPDFDSYNPNEQSTVLTEITGTKH